MSHRNPIQTGSIGGEELVQTLFRKLKMLVKGSSDQNHFIFEFNVGKSRI